MQNTIVGGGGGGGMAAGEKIENQELGEKMKNGEEKKRKVHKHGEKALKLHLFPTSTYSCAHTKEHKLAWRPTGSASR